MRIRNLDRLALVGSMGALAVAVMPTYRMEFMASPVRSEVFVEHVSWFSPLIVGYGDPLPVVSGVLCAVMVLCALLGALGAGRPGTLVVLSAAALVVMGAEVVVFGSGLLFGSGGIRGMAVLAPAGAALVLLVSMVSLIGGRRASRERSGHGVEGVAP